MSPEDLIGHLLGLLDAEEHRVIQERMESDAVVRGMIERLGQRLAVLEIDRKHWEPPRDLASRTCQRVRVLLDSGPRD